MKSKYDRFIKLLEILLIIIVLINIFSCNSKILAFDYPTDSFDPYSGNNSMPKGVDSLLKQALGIVQIIAGFAALISIIWLGVSFMKESPQGRAESKKKIYMILIGSLLIFGASKIIEIVADLAQKA